MITTLLTHDLLTRSVWAVPPLARNDDETINVAENQKIISHIESGGIQTLLYGGNAIFYHLRPSRYARALEMVSELAGEQTLVIPSVGPSSGVMLDQSEVLKDYSFPTVMILPQRDVASSKGVLAGISKFAERISKPIVLYLKYENYMTVEDVCTLVDAGLVSAIKYAVVREDYTKDDYLSQLVDQVDQSIIFSGLGDQPAVVHMRDFGLAGFTTGCGCVAPQLSTNLLKAILNKEFDLAEQIREQFLPLEVIRDSINPITVLHRAVEFAEIARTGPILPLLSEVEESLYDQIKSAAHQLIVSNQSA